MRTLIIKRSSPEEILLCLPVLDYLHRVFRGIEIDWLVDESCSGLLQDQPLLCRLLPSRYGDWRSRPFSVKNWREVAALKNTVQERRYDLVFDLEGTLMSGVVSRLTGCRRRYGFDDSLVAEPLNLRFDCNRVPMRRQDQHFTDRVLRLVSVPFGRDYAGQSYSAEIPLQPDDEARAALYMATLSDDLVFLFHLGGSARTGLWHEAGWIDLGRGLLELCPDATILLSGSGSDCVAERIAHGIGRQPRRLPELSFHGLAAILKKVDLVVGGDCVPVQLAACLGTPTVSFYRSTDGAVRAPRGDHHRHVQSTMTCSRCHEQSCDNDAACRENIGSDAVLKAAGDILFPTD